MPTLTLNTLYVFFFISHRRRRIEHVNVTRHPTADWVWRQVLEATPWGQAPRFLIRDRCYGDHFVARAKRFGIAAVLTPAHVPKANAIAERVVGTLRRDCVDHIIPLSERHLPQVLLEYVDYYNATRPGYIPSEILTCGWRAPAGCARSRPMSALALDVSRV